MSTLDRRGVGRDRRSDPRAEAHPTPLIPSGSVLGRAGVSAAPVGRTPSPARAPSFAMRYGFALLATAAGVGVYGLLEPLLANRVFFVLTPAIVLSAWYGGLGPGIVASILGVVVADHVLFPPVGVLGLDYGRNTAVLAIFLLLALLMSSTVGTLRRTQQQAEAARARSERVARRAAELEEAGRVLSASLDYDRTLLEIARLAARTLGDYSVVDILEEDGQIRRRVAIHRDPSKQALLDELKRWSPDPNGNAGVSRVLRTGEPIVQNDVDAEVLQGLVRDGEPFAAAARLQREAFMVVPMAARGQILGTLTVVSTTNSARSFGSEDVQFALELAYRAALAIDNARLMRAASAAVHVRDEVLGFVSHDLRNLLGLLHTTTEAVLDLDLPDERRRDLLERQRPVLVSATRLLGDLLDVTRAESGHMDLELEPIDASLLVREAAALFEAEAEKGGIILTAGRDGELPPVLADREMIQRVLANLLSNAVKFTPAGGSVEARARPGEPGTIVVEVSNTGPGIPPEEQPFIFDRFWHSRRERRAGAGLGLAIAKGIVDAHGGRLQVRSVPGGFTTFSFTLPAAETGAPARL